jgi:hypothetical protein
MQSDLRLACSHCSAAPHRTDWLKTCHALWYSILMREKEHHTVTDGAGRDLRNCVLPQPPNDVQIALETGVVSSEKRANYTQKRECMHAYMQDCHDALGRQLCDCVSGSTLPVEIENLSLFYFCAWQDKTARISDEDSKTWTKFLRAQQMMTR